MFPYFLRSALKEYAGFFFFPAKSPYFLAQPDILLYKDERYKGAAQKLLFNFTFTEKPDSFLCQKYGKYESFKFLSTIL